MCYSEIITLRHATGLFLNNTMCWVRDEKEKETNKWLLLKLLNIYSTVNIQGGIVIDVVIVNVTYGIADLNMLKGCASYAAAGVMAVSR